MSSEVEENQASNGDNLKKKKAWNEGCYLGWFSQHEAKQFIYSNIKIV